MGSESSVVVGLYDWCVLGIRTATGSSIDDPAALELLVAGAQRFERISGLWALMFCFYLVFRCGDRPAPGIDAAQVR